MTVALVLALLLAVLLLGILWRRVSDLQRRDALRFLRDQESEVRRTIRAQRLDAEAQMRRLADRRPWRP
ncbi:hypothetical protein [Parafrankia sp. BMG5.11]|uniref:hypothetical protein n=1 Tax=Parafrankia sp. BMG5.11 TaxID=222540 RepID=UPI00103866C0|nr:hypothetical protein [Parafrankia sp. BMG5.11]TCJ35196.1 hypothetical protein E0504_29345 [Parafrankia sp. BMG5.11]